MKYLITGGAGFIGSHIVDRLLAQGDQVIVLDDFSVGKKENLPKSHPNLVIFESDIMVDNVSPLLFEGVDILIHLGALTRPRESFINPEETFRVNVLGTKRMLELSKNVKKFIFTSSASVYGYQDEFPFQEHAKLNPASPYALTKQLGEDMANYYSEKMQINIIRPFNVYGDRQDPNSPYASAVSTFINSLKTGKEISISGDGTQFRDFIFIDDIVDLFLKVANSDLTGQTFNGGTGVTTNINKLHKTICAVMGADETYKRSLYVEDPNTKAYIGKAWTFFGWRPKYNLVAGLTKTVERLSK